MAMDGKFREFLQVKGEYSLRNLTTLLSISVGSLIVFILACSTGEHGDTQLSEGIFTAYLLAGGGVYCFGKWQDEKTERFRIDSTPPPAPVTTVQNANVVNTPGTPPPSPEG